MKDKPFITILITVIILGGIIGGTLVGGIALGKNQGQEQASQDIQSLFSSRFGMRDQMGDSNESGNEQPASPGGFMGRMGMGTVGTVTSVDGNIITVETMQGSVDIVIAEDTSIQKMDDGSLEDITPGTYITVSGEKGEDGSVEATSVYLIPQGIQAP